MTAHYVYRCYGADGRLVYVGCSKDWTVRLETHRRSTFWATHVVQVRVSVYRSSEIAHMVERRAISDEHPRFNIQGRWRTHAQWVPAQWDDYLTALTAGTSAQRGHMKEVFRTFKAVYGEPHPTEAASRAEWAERDAINAVRAAESRAEHALRRAQIEAADRLVLVEHFADCSVCLAADEWSIDCPDIEADLAREAAEEADSAVAS